MISGLSSPHKENMRILQREKEEEKLERTATKATFFMLSSDRYFLFLEHQQVRCYSESTMRDDPPHKLFYPCVI